MSLTDSITYLDLVDICVSGARILVVASAAGFRALTLLSAAAGVSAWVCSCVFFNFCENSSCSFAPVKPIWALRQSRRVWCNNIQSIRWSNVKRTCHSEDLKILLSISPALASLISTYNEARSKQRVRSKREPKDMRSLIYITKLWISTCERKPLTDQNSLLHQTTSQLVM